MRFVLLIALGSTLAACVVSERCFRNEDCGKGQICDENGRCTSEPSLPDVGVPIRCPLPNMVKVDGRFCIDVYEAARPDATSQTPGVDDSRAVSRKGVLPWMLSAGSVANENGVAEAACQAAGKRLCSPAEWLLACQGPDGTVYSYGDPYEETTCNGIDAFGDPNQYNFHLTPTGDFPDCTNEWGVFDINGNLWEHTAGGSEKTVRGGAYNCGDSKTLHRCDYVPGWVPSARGFRCCADGVPETVDAGQVEGLPPLPDSGAADLSMDLELDGAAADAQGDLP